MRRRCLEYQGRRPFALAVMVGIASISGASHAGASDLGPQTGQHVGKVIAWDSTNGRLVLVDPEMGKRPRRIILWTDPQTMVTTPRSDPQDLFGHDKGRGRLGLADLKPGNRVEVEWRRAGRRHVAVSLRRMP